MVSNASDDLPEPLTPVMTISWPTGSEMLTFLQVVRTRAASRRWPSGSKGADGMTGGSGARLGLMVSAPTLDATSPATGIQGRPCQGGGPFRPRYGAAVGTAAGLVDCPAMRIPGFPASRAGNSHLAILVLLAFAFCSAPATAQPASPAAQPAPPLVANGPLPVTAASYPFGAADHTRVPEDLRAIGYVEEEFLVSGTANVYDWSAPGRPTVRTAGAPYTTRVLVRRPAAQARFSGNAVVEMLNPSNMFDLNIGWGVSAGRSSGVVTHGSASRPSRCRWRH